MRQNKQHSSALDPNIYNSLLSLSDITRPDSSLHKRAIKDRWCESDLLFVWLLFWRRRFCRWFNLSLSSSGNQLDLHSSSLSDSLERFYPDHHPVLFLLQTLLQHPLIKLLGSSLKLNIFTVSSQVWHSHSVSTVNNPPQLQSQMKENSQQNVIRGKSSLGACEIPPFIILSSPH